MNKQRNLLQTFADGNNAGAHARSFQKEFKELLKAVFGAQGYFADFFAGGLEALDGVQENEHAFYVKTSDTPVVVGTGYDKDENKAFGTGTASASRFGERKEIIYKDTPVDYSWGWTYHEGIDRQTVNNDFEAAVADRLELQARAKVAAFNKAHGKFISQSAGKTIAGGQTITKDNVGEVFGKIKKHFVNEQIIGKRIAKVTADVYNAIVDSNLSTTSKGSSVNMDNGEVRMFKGFEVQEIPEDLFGSKEVIYAYVEGIGKAFTGINTARTIESENFDGVALQGAGKAGEFILEDNKKAVVKVTITGA